MSLNLTRYAKGKSKGKCWPIKMIIRERKEHFKTLTVNVIKILRNIVI